MKKISVIIATYNGSKTIEKTIESILNQDRIGVEFIIELIIADDCSLDNTVSLLEKYDCILIQNSKNSKGPNKGRNKGLRVASGDFICISDQDDIWKKNKIISLLPYLDRAPIITSGYEIIDHSKKKVIQKINSTVENYLFFESNQTFLKRLTKSLDGQNAYMGSIIYSSHLKNIEFEEYFGMVDFDWLLRLFHQQESIEVCQVLYERIVDGANLSLNNLYRKNDFYFSLMTIENYEAQYPLEVSIAYKKIHGSRARYYYLIGDMKKARFYFIKSQWNTKTLMYYLTTFFGSKFVKKHFNVFG